MLNEILIPLIDRVEVNSAAERINAEIITK